MPEATLRAFGDHGVATRARSGRAVAAEQTLRHAQFAGIDLAAITADVARDGVRSFCETYHELSTASRPRSDGWGGTG
jgi:transaldolase